jgi:hypothetical protein
MNSRLTSKVANTYMRKKAGWWAIDEEGDHTAPEPLYGNLQNVVPGYHNNSYEMGGDHVADLMGDTLKKIYDVYMEVWDRPPTDHEMETLFKTGWKVLKQMEEEKRNP